MLLESVGAPLDDFWSAQDSGVRGCSGSWSRKRNTWQGGVQGHYGTPEGAETLSWQSGLTFCILFLLCVPSWEHRVGRAVWGTALLSIAPKANHKKTIKKVKPAAPGDEPLGWAGWKLLALLCPFPVPSIGRSGRSPWMCPVPTTSWGRAALPQKLIVLPARRQLPSALTQTAFWFCYCLDAWKSVDSLSCSICYSFGKMFNILQPEDRTKAGWGFC